MVMTDPIADLLTRIRNGLMRRQERVDIPHSKIKWEVVRLLKAEGFISNAVVVKEEGRFPVIRVGLKYLGEYQPVISGLERVSRPGRRVYVRVEDVPAVKGGLGLAVVSTPQGLMTDRESRRRRLGGEVLCYVW